MTNRSATVLRVPEGLDFADLDLRRDPVTHDVEFSWEPIEQLCAHNGLDIAAMRESEDNISALLIAWYVAHRAAGGAADPVEEQILAEVAAEDARGAVNVQQGPARQQ